MGNMYQLVLLGSALHSRPNIVPNQDQRPIEMVGYSFRAEWKPVYAADLVQTVFSIIAWWQAL